MGEGRSDNNGPATFVTTFSKEYKQVVDIIKRNLPILYSGTGLHKVLGVGCHFSSRRAPTLDSLLSLSLFTSQKHQPTWLSYPGSFPCNLKHVDTVVRMPLLGHLAQEKVNSTLTVGFILQCTLYFVLHVICSMWGALHVPYALQGVLNTIHMRHSISENAMLGICLLSG